MVDHENSHMPTLLYNSCYDRIHVIWNIKTTILKPDSTDNLHRVHPFPRLLQGTELPHYDPKAKNITPESEKEKKQGKECMVS